MKAADNPFSTDKIHAVGYRFKSQSPAEAESELEDFIVELKYRNFYGAIIGPEGSGKTTLVESICRRLNALNLPVRVLRLGGDSKAGFFSFHSLLDQEPKDTILIIDGAEQIGRLGWIILRNLISRRQRVIVTAHDEGLLPTLHRCLPNYEIAIRIVAELTGREQSDVGELTERLFSRHHGNIRDVLREMYDLAADGLIPL